MTSAPPLPAVLASLLAIPKPAHITLTGKLTLAYTPGSANIGEPGTHRLTLSRHGQWPSEQEVETVKRDLAVALRAAGRSTDGICVEWWLEGTGNIRYHVLFWKELVQASLI